MTEKQPEEQETQTNDFKPSKWFNCVPVKVSKIVLQRSGKENEFIERIRLETDIGNITYRPKKRITETATISGFETETTKSELFTLSEFFVDNPMLVELNKNKTEKKPEEVILSYAETSREDDRSGERIYYMYMLKSQFSTIYYDKFHTDTKETLDKQKEAEKKHKEKEM